MQNLYKSKLVRKLLGISRERLIAGIITLGYPDEQYCGVPPRQQGIMHVI